MSYVGCRIETNYITVNFGKGLEQVPLDRTLNENNNNGDQEGVAIKGSAGHDFHSEYQYGFIKGRGTIDVILKVIRDVKNFRAIPHPRQKRRQQQQQLAVDDGLRSEKFTTAAVHDIKGPFDAVWSCSRLKTKDFLEG